MPNPGGQPRRRTKPKARRAGALRGAILSGAAMRRPAATAPLSATAASPSLHHGKKQAASAGNSFSMPRSRQRRAQRRLAGGDAGQRNEPAAQRSSSRSARRLALGEDDHRASPPHSPPRPDPRRQHQPARVRSPAWPAKLGGRPRHLSSGSGEFIGGLDQGEACLDQSLADRLDLGSGLRRRAGSRSAGGGRKKGSVEGGDIRLVLLLRWRWIPGTECGLAF